MTTLVALGSGSSGNCFAVEHDGAVLLVDAGFSAREISRRAELAGLDLGRLVGIALTHEHGDHCAGAARLARDSGAPVFASEGTWRCLRGRMPAVGFRPLALKGQCEAGPFVLEAVRTSHDAAEPVALAVRAGLTRVGFAYDLGRPTTSVRYLLRHAHALVIEANHDEVLLRTSGYPPTVQQRIIGSGGHLSNRMAAELVTELLHPALGAVVLAHLSERCNSEAEARAAVEPVLQRAGHRCRLHVARQNEPLPAIRVGSEVLELW